VRELPAEKYKTDFAEGYENALKLDKILNKAGGSLEYSEIFMYGQGSEQKKLYVIGIPSFDEIKKTFEYRYMWEIYKNGLTVSVTSYDYGEGRPLMADEIQGADEVVDLLYQSHEYLTKHDLSEEICWNDYTRGVGVNHRADNGYQDDEADDEIEDGCEP
jgi:hypothetical protein